MKETRDDNRVDETVAPTSSWCDLDFMKKLQVDSTQDDSSCKESKCEHDLERLEAQKASQTLWAHGKLSQPIPNGFYSVLLERRLKESFDVIPSLEELYSMDSKGIGLDVVIVDMRKDKKVSMLKQLTLTLAKGLYPNPVALIKKIAGLVYDFYKRPNVEPNHVKDVMVDGSDALDNHGIQMLGQTRHGSCHQRSILFKFLADAVGINSMLIAGLPREGVLERTDSYKHMSVLVVLNSVEKLVDLVRHPGQLVPYSTKTIFMSHIFLPRESDSPENDSCDSPLEPTNPLCSFLEHLGFESTENDERLKTSYQHRLDAGVDVSALSMREMMSKTAMKGNIMYCSSHSVPYVPNVFWNSSRTNAGAEKRTSSSITSPEHSLMQGRGRSILGRNRDSFMEFGTASRSAGASPVAYRRRRRHSICMIPEIGDDVVRVVRAINETLKQLPRDVDALTSYSAGEDHHEPDPQVSDFHTNNHDDISDVKSTEYTLNSYNISHQKAISLPSSPHKRTGATECVGSDDIITMWNKLLESSKILNKPLLPYPEWNIDFSELIVGSRVGIGFFGEVFRGIWNGTEVAIKVLLEQELSVENIEDFYNEISILSRLRHPNVISFLGACTLPPRLSLVTEYMEMGSLYYLVHVSGQRKRLSWRRRFKMLCDICRGLMCIHRMKVAHRDLKSANCLVSKYWTVKICDFGLSRVLTTTPMRDSSSAGTPEWMAPELIRNEPFTEKCDIFSLGVIIWELCTLNKPWEGVPSTQVIYQVANDGLRLEIPEGPLGELIADCWAEPNQRPSCEEILSRLFDCEHTHC